jgi:hypothetical protein
MTIGAARRLAASCTMTAAAAPHVDQLQVCRPGQANPRPGPPSSSAALPHGRHSCAPAGDALQPCRRGSRSCPWSIPHRWSARPPPRLCVRRADEPLCDSICSIVPMPAVRQKRSNELSTSCQANSRLGKSRIRAITRVSHVSKAIILALSPIHPSHAKACLEVPIQRPTAFARCE